MICLNDLDKLVVRPGQIMYIRESNDRETYRLGSGKTINYNTNEDCKSLEISFINGNTITLAYDSKHVLKEDYRRLIQSME